MKTYLFRHIDNSSLVVFRIFFGLLCFLESVGAVVTGWVRRTLVEPEFTFSFIGFDWLQPLPGQWMYVFYIVMGMMGLAIMLGYKYRMAAFVFAVMWACTYLMQKSSYNNHYYLLMLLSFIMVVLPANRYASVDVKMNPQLKQISMPNWCRAIFILQLFILYSYASIAKLYPDWLDGSTVALLMKPKANYPIVGELLQQPITHYCIAYGGILFDGLIIPALIWKRTRKIAFFISIFFHLFNSFVFQIGIFPYLALAFTLFFYSPKTIRNIFLKKKALYIENDVKIPKYHHVITVCFVTYLAIQLTLPVRHHFIKDDVLWTEEGHRLSWRMMLRAKSGRTSYTVIDKTSNSAVPINLDNYLTKKQQRSASTKPDVIWQFAQRLKEKFAQEGKDVAVYVNAYVSVNGKPSKQLIDPEVDLASVEWNAFKHSSWLLPSK